MAMHEIFIALPVIVLVIALYRVLTSPYRTIPGPFLAPFTKLWYFNHVRLGSFEKDNIELHRRYGPIVRIGPNLFSINDSASIQTVYGIASKFPKADWYDGWTNPKSDRWTLFPDRNIARHSDTRKRFQRMYSMSEMVSYERFVESCGKIFDTRLREFAAQGQAIDMAHWFQCYAFDVIGEVTYSARFGFLDDGEDKSGLLKALHRTQIYSTMMGIYAGMHRRVWDLAVRIPWTGAGSREYLMEFVDRQIARRDKERKKRALQGVDPKLHEEDERPEDFLDKLMNSHDEDPDKVTTYHIFMMGLSNIIAGSDTTAVSLSSVLYYLVKNPDTKLKLLQEIQNHERQNLSSSPDITFKESQELVYLQAVIKEALRLHAATGLPLWRVVPQGGANICGHFLPSGTVVGLNSWVAHYSKEVFGPDPDEFRPERWIEAEKDQAKLKAMNASWMPFGLGSRTCLGRHVSMLEMCKLIPRLVRNFDFELVERDAHWKTVNYWFVKPVGLWMKITARNQVSSDQIT